MPAREDFLRGPRIDPRPITGRETVPELVDNAFLAYNAGRLADGCRLFTQLMLEDAVTVGMSLTGAMTPAGLGISRRSLLGVAHECGVPIYTSSPGDSSIGMNVAEQALAGSRLRFDVSADVNETSAVVLHAKRHGGKSGVLIIGGGSPKNFVLQTEPQIQEVLGIAETGHDYYLQITDARPDTGGLS